MRKIRQNDEVVIIAGKDKGKQGKVQRVLVDKGRVVVEGVNMVKRHIRPNPNLRQTGIVQSEAPIHVNYYARVAVSRLGSGLNFLKMALRPGCVKYAEKQ